jgi:hypothetical protein
LSAAAKCMLKPFRRRAKAILVGKIHEQRSQGC